MIVLFSLYELGETTVFREDEAHFSTDLKIA